MDYGDALTFRRDLNRRLEERCGDDDLCLAHARRDIACDRLLARVVAAVPAGWSLSGDLALGLRFPERPRKGWDVKIEWPVDRYDAVHLAPLQIMEHDAGDLFELVLGESGGGVVGGRVWQHFEVQASLGQEHFSRVSLTLSLNYGPLPTERLLTEDTLGFAGIRPVEVDTVLLEIQAAELLHRHVAECEHGLNPTRLDRLRDLGLIAARSGLDGATLGDAIAQIYARKESEPPASLPHPFEGWAEPLRRMAATAGRPDDFLPGYDGVVELFDPLLGGEVAKGTWDATHRRWQEPGEDADGELPPI